MMQKLSAISCTITVLYYSEKKKYSLRHTSNQWEVAYTDTE